MHWCKKKSMLLVRRYNIYSNTTKISSFVIERCRQHDKIGGITFGATHIDRHWNNIYFFYNCQILILYWLDFLFRDGSLKFITEPHKNVMPIKKFSSLLSLLQKGRLVRMSVDYNICAGARTKAISGGEITGTLVWFISNFAFFY